MFKTLWEAEKEKATSFLSTKRLIVRQWTMNGGEHGNG
jgi:hypothetical protein